MGGGGGGGSFIFNKFCRQHSLDTGDLQPLPYEALTGGGSGFWGFGGSNWCGENGPG